MLSIPHLSPFHGVFAVEAHTALLRRLLGEANSLLVSTLVILPRPHV